MVSMAAVEMLTREDLDAMPDDGNRYELIEGEIVVSPSPRSRHQFAVVELIYLVRLACPEHLRVGTAPFDVVLSESSVVQPDVFVLDPNEADDRGLNGPPLLAVEVLSPTTRRRDLTVKKRLYEQVGVAAYWVVDAEIEGLALTAWELRDGRYDVVASIAGDEEWTATVPFEVTVVPSRLVR